MAEATAIGLSERQRAAGWDTIHGQGRSRLPWTVVLCILALGAAVGAMNLWHPIDGRSWEVWRETDVAGIARNFTREGMHIMSPRIDWRRDGPGYVEMEFPIYPYVIALGYKVLGFHEQIGRVLSYVAALTTLFLFLRIAAFVLPPPGAIVAGLFFAVNPIAVRLATTIQPEPFMLLGYVGAMYAFIRWLDDDRWGWYWTALVLTSFAILAKAPAAHIGLAFLFLALWRKGPRVLTDWRLWAFAIVALVPPALWYARAREFWLVYGNSLGASNHQHIVGLAAITNPGYVQQIVGIDVHFIWSFAALLAVGVAVALGPRLPGLGYGLLWYAAVFIYYLVIAGTSAYPWGTYYHIVALPPVALLVGWAGAVVARRLRERDLRDWLQASTAFLGITVASIAASHFGLGTGPVLVAAAATTVLLVWQARARAGNDPRTRQALATGALLSCLIVGFVSILKITAAERHPHQERSIAEYETARRFAPLIPPGVPLAVSGSYCVSKVESAFEEPWYFYWTDHKGFSLCTQDNTPANAHALADRGVHYYIVERGTFAWRPGFEAEMRRQFTVLAETSDAVLFRI